MATVKITKDKGPFPYCAKVFGSNGLIDLSCSWTIWGARRAAKKILRQSKVAERLIEEYEL